MQHSGNYLKTLLKKKHRELKNKKRIEFLISQFEAKLS